MAKKPFPKKWLYDLEAKNARSSSPWKGHTILAIDYGEKYCGLAYSPDGVLALALKVIPTEKLLETLETLKKEKPFQILVLGLPISSGGGENALCQKIRALGARIASQDPSLALHFVNERFSSQNTLTREKGRIDDLAALQILEFFLHNFKKNFKV